MFKEIRPKLQFKRKKAFTLMELMIVMSIVLILFVSFNTSARFAADKTRMAGVQTDFREFFNAVEMIGSKANLSEITNSEFEQQLNELLHEDSKFTAGISKHKDPWGNSYRYCIDVTDGVFSVAFASSGRKTEEEYFFNVASATENQKAFEPRLVMFISMDTGKVKDTINNDIKATLIENIKNLPNPIMGHPVTQSVLAGYTATFSVDTSTLIVSGYQWYENDTEIPGATSATYVKTAQLADDGNIYHCKVTVNGKDYLSDRARLDVYRLSAEQLQIMAYPSKLTYAVGEDFSTAGLVLKAYFNDGTNKNVTDYTVTNGTNLQKDTTEIVIVYDGVSCTIPIQVRDSGTASNPIALTITSSNIAEFNIGTSGALVIPELVTDGSYWYRITEIADGTFANKTLTSVTIPSGVTYIGSSAFKGNPNLNTVTIPDTVTTIGDYAFADCGQLTVNYGGTGTQWDAINMNETWNSNSTVTLKTK